MRRNLSQNLQMYNQRVVVVGIVEGVVLKARETCEGGVLHVVEQFFGS
jgi:hypothetical protein